MDRLPVLAYCVLLFGSVGPAAMAQVATSGRPVETELSSGGSTDSVSRFVANVDVVDVFFNVRKRGHQLVPGLPKEEFKILENGREQTIKYYSESAEQPLKVALMIDTSGSQEQVLEQERTVGESFLDEVLSNGDEALVVSFDDGVEVKTEFTSDRRRLTDGLARTHEGSANDESLGDSKVPKRTTALYDAITLVSRNRMARTAGRKVLVILTDGDDRGSRTDFSHAVEAAIRADTICYVLLIVDPRTSSQFQLDMAMRMHKLSKKTGGRLIKVKANLKDLGARLAEVSHELRSHYSIGYTPENRDYRGEYRKIKVISKRGYEVQSRPGYFAKFQTEAAAKR